MTSTFPNSRPGGRAANVTARITQAAIDLLIEGGIEACTFANVADRAAVQRSTLYRRYDDRWAMIMEAIANRADTTMTATGEGTFANDLRDVLTKLGAALASPLGAAGMMAAANLRGEPDREKARRYWPTRLKQLDPMFDAAIDRGELPADIDREELFAFAAGPLYFRVFVTQQEPDPACIDAIVEAIRARYCLI